MQYITDSEFHIDHSAVALGKFEGIHRGHQLLIQEITNHEDKLQSVMFTFSMPPAILLKGAKYQTIYTKEERHHILEGMGIDILIEYPFTREFASMTPSDFIHKVLVEKVGAKLVVIGADFHFGKNRSGSIEDLEKYKDECGYDLKVIDKLQIDGKDVSSTRIRECLTEGDMEMVTKLLGRPYSVHGTVIHGKELGRTIQIPTVNQEIKKEKFAPRNGVYVSRIILDSIENSSEKKVYYGITNVGVKPTVKDTLEKNIETNIFDFSGDLYDRKLTVELLHFKRPEIKFDSVEALKAQMMQDIQFGRGFVQELK
ncbi:MAG: bifunctional riboflavin kinase/FAD synthetase [Lachnospiraceae bacterium]|nr:bifunctional riboflavin kinase/FAD synthetase [Lachnospiraceae bacterium]